MKYLITITFLLQVWLAAGQQEAIAYQTILKTSSQQVLKFVDTEVKVDLIQDNANGEIVYSEIHQTKTGLNGEVNLEIGKGNPVFMSLDNVTWSKPNYVELSIKPKGFNDFLSNGSVRLLSVPYALFAIDLSC